MGKKKYKKKAFKKKVVKKKVKKKAKAKAKKKSLWDTKGFSDLDMKFVEKEWNPAIKPKFPPPKAIKYIIPKFDWDKPLTQPLAKVKKAVVPQPKTQKSGIQA